MSHLYPKTGRVIFHIDMNCFYASVETAFDPTLQGKPVAIAGNPKERKGIVVTSSYEARAKGVKTTMPLWQAKRLCPNLIVRPPNFERYRAASKAMFKILAEVTTSVEPISIDEGYLDITNCKELGHPIDIARNIQKRLLEELKLPSSLGIAPNKFLAKMASDMEKPLGLTILRKRDLETVLWPLEVGEMHGIGAKTEEKLNEMDIFTIGDLATANTYTLTQLLGINGERLKLYANGDDQRLVNPDSVYDFKSIGSSRTLPDDTVDETVIFNLFNVLIKQVELRLNRRELVGSSVQLMIRYHDRETVTRSKKLATYIADYTNILQIVRSLWNEHWTGEPVRLLGVTIQDIEERKIIGEQLDIFSYERMLKETKIAATVDTLTKKYGTNPFVKSEQKKINKEYEPTTSFQKDFLDDYRLK